MSLQRKVGYVRYAKYVPRQNDQKQCIIEQAVLSGPFGINELILLVSHVQFCLRICWRTLAVSHIYCGEQTQ